MLRVGLVDDEPLARQWLRRLIAGHAGVQVLWEAESNGQALRLLGKHRPDAIFLDIQMPGATGFELLSAIHPSLQVVFVTAHAEHAVRAFDVAATDYLLKPVSAARFAEAIRRIEAACWPDRPAEPPPAYSQEDRICLHTPEKTLVAPLGSIPALQADGDFTRIFLKSSPALMICQKLGHYQKLLPSPPFFRIDRSHIINLEAVIRMDRTSRNSATLVLDGVPQGLAIGRTAQSRLARHLP